MSEVEVKKRPNILAILLVGVLSMVFGEVFSGASPLWFFRAWDWFVTFPLYWAHAILLINLALRFERTSITQLYLWGIIFGLYESWITKVLWAGYMDSSPAFGSFLGFATAEFFVIGLFWHAVFSFIIPILVFQIIVQGTNKGEAVEIHPSHLYLIAKNTRNKVILSLVIIIGAIFMTVGVGADTLAIIIGGGVSVAFIILLGYLTTSLSKTPIDLDSLRLGPTGLSITIVYLIALYVFTFLTILPERIPSIGTILLTIVFYIVILTMLFLTPRDNRKTIELPSGIMSFEQILWALTTFLMIAIMLALVQVVALVAWYLFYILLIFVGPVLFFLAIVQVFRKAEISDGN